jgi:hypothetical protein
MNPRGSPVKPYKATDQFGRLQGQSSLIYTPTEALGQYGP